MLSFTHSIARRSAPVLQAGRSALAAPLLTRSVTVATIQRATPALLTHTHRLTHPLRHTPSSNVRSFSQAASDGQHAAGWSPASVGGQIPLSEIDPSQDQPPLPKHKEYGYVVYTSPFEKSVKALKMMSLTSAMLSIASAPVMVVLADHLPLAGRLAVAGTVLSFGVSTTLALGFFTRSYVIRIFANRDTSLPVDPTATADEQAAQQWRMTIQTFNLMGRPVHTSGRHSDFHPLHSRMFNNTRLESSLESNSKKKDLFVHLDIAEHPLLQTWWNKPTILSAQPTKMEVMTHEGEMPVIQDRTLTREQARREIEEEQRLRKEQEQQQQQKQ